MSAEVIEYSAPKGVRPHEAAFILREEGDDSWSWNFLFAAMLELVAAERLNLERDAKGHPRIWKRGASERPQDSPALALVEETLIASSADPSVQDDRLPQFKAALKRQLAERGLSDPASDELTDEGRRAVEGLRGYRAYLKKAMIGRTHMGAAEGRIDADTMFTAAFGAMNFANVTRAILRHEGLLKPGEDDRWLRFFGGTDSAQHGASASSGSEATLMRKGLLVYGGCGALMVLSPFIVLLLFDGLFRTVRWLSAPLIFMLNTLLQMR